MENIKNLKAEIKRLKELAYKDELTKLYNRRGFKEEIGLVGASEEDAYKIAEVVREKLSEEEVIQFSNLDG